MDMGITRIFVSMDFIKLNDIKYSKDLVNPHPKHDLLNNNLNIHGILTSIIP